MIPFTRLGPFDDSTCKPNCFIGECANGQFFRITCKLRHCLLFLPGIHVAKKVFVMISSTERSFLCPLWGTFVFYGGQTCAAVAASRSGVVKEVHFGEVENKHLYLP